MGCVNAQKCSVSSSTPTSAPHFLTGYASPHTVLGGGGGGKWHNEAMNGNEAGVIEWGGGGGNDVLVI